MPRSVAARCATGCVWIWCGSPGSGPTRRCIAVLIWRRPGRHYRVVKAKRMTEANEQEKRPLTLRSGGTLGLRRPVETGQVRQSFSHGRSQQVTVEVRKKRVLTPGSAPEPGQAEPTPTVAVAQPASPAAAPETAEPRRLGGPPRTRPAEEQATRVRALQHAGKADGEGRRRAALREEDRR